MSSLDTGDKDIGGTTVSAPLSEGGAPSASLLSRFGRWWQRWTRRRARRRPRLSRSCCPRARSASASSCACASTPASPTVPPTQRHSLACRVRGGLGSVAPAMLAVLAEVAASGSAAEPKVARGHGAVAGPVERASASSSAWPRCMASRGRTARRAGCISSSHCAPTCCAGISACPACARSTGGDVLQLVRRRPARAAAHHRTLPRRCWKS